LTHVLTNGLRGSIFHLLIRLLLRSNSSTSLRGASLSGGGSLLTLHLSNDCRTVVLLVSASS
jgi:hypothetical protein